MNVQHQEGKPNVNYGFGVQNIVICQGSFINCNKCVTLVALLLMEKVIHGWEQEKITVPSTHFWDEPTTALKKIKFNNTLLKIHWGQN